MRLIDSDALITWIKESQKMTSKVKAILCYIETMPSPNKPTGEWMGDKCSVCGSERAWYGNNPPYCPDCGSRMRIISVDIAKTSALTAEQGMKGVDECSSK